MKYLKSAPIGFALALASNSKTWLERVSKDKRSSIIITPCRQQQRKKVLWHWDLLVGDVAYLDEIVVGAARGGAEGGHHEKGNQALKEKLGY